MEDNQRMILATLAAALPESTLTTSFTPVEGLDMWETLNSSGLWLGPRETLETYPTFRQIIPYIVLSVDGRVIHYTRTPKGQEARLHDKVSVGFGGHVDLEDMQFFGNSIDLERTLNIGADREIDEEIGIVDVIKKTWVGLVVSNENPVDHVHIGVVAHWELASAPTGMTEDAVGNVGLDTPDALLMGVGDRLETWSWLYLQYLGRVEDASE